MTDLPEVECIGCARKVSCIRVNDGTTYKPFAWTYPIEAEPLRGFCGGCQVKAEADDFLEKVKRCRTADEYATLLRTLGLEPMVQTCVGSEEKSDGK